jgi:flagellar biosynthesis protein FlhA
MDGASKFVRGDAIASILILLINMVGGVAIGAFMHDLSLADAFREYALLTIGDGLVAQIPALLLSSAAAIIVTRVSDSGDFEGQVASQLLASPPVMYGAAGVMFLLGVIPGMPWLTFMAFAAALAFVGWRLDQRPAKADPDPDQVATALLADKPPELDWRSLPMVEPVTLTVGYKLVALVDPGQSAPLTRRVNGVRQTLSESLGFLVPAIGVRDDLGLKPLQYVIQFSGSVVAQGEIVGERLMAIPSPQVYGDLDGIPAVEPAYSLPVVWIEPDQKGHALGLGYQVVDGPSVIATHLSKVMQDLLPELLRHEDVHALNERLAAQAPKLAAALDKAITPSQLLKVYRALLAENVSLKDIVAIGTTLLENAETTKDPLLLAAEVRCTLRRQIVSGLVAPGIAMKAFSLGGSLENLLLGALNQARSAGKVALDNFPVDPQLLAQLQQNLPLAREQMKQQGATPMLLVMPQIRPLLARYARLFAPGLNVLSYNEIPEQREVNIIGAMG